MKRCYLISDSVFVLNTSVCLNIGLFETIGHDVTIIPVEIQKGEALNQEDVMSEPRVNSNSKKVLENEFDKLKETFDGPTDAARDALDFDPDECVEPDCHIASDRQPEQTNEEFWGSLNDLNEVLK